MTREKQIAFDFNEILKQYRKGKRLTGKDGLLAPLIKQLTEATLEAELESHIANDALSGKSNRRNGFNEKTIKGTSDGSSLLETPRDRNGTFEPQIVKKHQTTLSNEIEEKILSTYGLGMSYTDISSHIQDIRKVIYTTNIIESVHRQFRKLTKTKGAFPNENSLLKLLYMGIKNTEKKWALPV